MITSMQAWKVLNDAKSLVDETQKQVDALRSVEESVKANTMRKQSPDVALSYSNGSVGCTLRLSAAEIDHILEVLRIMRGQELAQAVETFETIDLLNISDEEI
jgi:hypothetical protein